MFFKAKLNFTLKGMVSGLTLLLALIIIYPFNISGQTENINEPFPLTVLSYNLRFGELASLEQFAEFIKKEDPDIVALQEVDVKTNRPAAPHQNGKDFITELGYLTGMLTAYARTIDYSGGYYGIGILSKYPFKKTKKIMLPMPEGAKEQRAALIADVELPGEKCFTFVSTHLDHSVSLVRLAQVKAINKELKKNRYPLIIAGDFNGRPDSPEISEGMKGWAQACSPDFTISSDNPEAKIDYIFYRPSKRWKVISSSTPLIKLSDHLPVKAEIELH
jgi:endonuclease/exonuclease/phosphatase family metal-dependent hydrolase